MGMSKDRLCCASEWAMPKAASRSGDFPFEILSRSKPRQPSAPARESQRRAVRRARTSTRTEQPAGAANPRRACSCRRDGALPAERLPLILEVAPNDDYALLDSGDGEKLEQYGPYRIVRPEGQAIWQKALPAARLGTGRRHFHRRHRRGRHRPLALSRRRRSARPGRCSHDGIDYLGRFTSFRHVGVFPEQASHWDHMAGLIETRAAAGQGAQPVRLYRPCLAGGGARRRRGHPCRRLQEGDRLGAREPGDGRPRRASRSAGSARTP